MFGFKPSRCGDVQQEVLESNQFYWTRTTVYPKVSKLLSVIILLCSILKSSSPCPKPFEPSRLSERFEELKGCRAVVPNPGPGEPPTWQGFDVSLILHTFEVLVSLNYELTRTVRCVLLGRYLKRVVLRILLDQDWEPLCRGQLTVPSGGAKYRDVVIKQLNMHKESKEQSVYQLYPSNSFLKSLFKWPVLRTSFGITLYYDGHAFPKCASAILNLMWRKTRLWGIGL